MNLPNIITLSRIPLTFVIVGLMGVSIRGAATAAFWIFIIAAVGDWLDGYLARKQKIVSNFGRFMDALADKILVLGLLIALVAREMGGAMWPLCAVLVVLSREFLVSGMRMIAATKGVVVAAERGGKPKTLTQMIAIGTLLAVPMISQDIGPWLGVDATEFVTWVQLAGMILFYAGTVLTVSSGLTYAVKYRSLFMDDATK